MEEMIHWYYKGYDMVLGIRDSRKTDGFFKRIFSKGFYKIMQVLGANSVYNHGDFRLLAKPLVNALKEYPEKNRYLFQSRVKQRFIMTEENVYMGKLNLSLFN